MVTAVRNDGMQPRATSTQPYGQHSNTPAEKNYLFATLRN